jgi:Arc/MetJ family transcription regulator
MRTTIALDDDLVRIAQEFTGVAEKTALIREALKALIERESARRLASLGALILADTSVWIDHLRLGNDELRKQLDRGQIAIHPCILAELALGSLKERSRTRFES